VLGLAYVAFQVWRLNNHIREIAYRPNAELAQALDDVQQTLQDSVNIINRFQEGTGSGKVPESLSHAPEFLISYDSLASLKQADEQLDQSKADVDSLKDFLIASLQQNINDLVTQLRAHAAALDGSATPAPPPSPTPAPIIKPGLQGLFAEDVTSEMAEERKQHLRQVEDLLGVLFQRTEKPENQAKIKSSIDELHRLEGLLGYLTIPGEIITATANLQPNPNPAGAPNPELPASKIADLLEGSSGIIEENITTRWLIDNKISAAKPLVAQEQREAESAQIQISNAYIDFYEETFLTLVIVCVLAYALQIAADILQAHIDNAENSFPQYQIPVDSNVEG